MQQKVGEIGWASDQLVLTRDLEGNFHGIQKGEFRAQAERKVTVMAKNKTLCTNINPQSYSSHFGHNPVNRTHEELVRN